MLKMTNALKVVTKQLIVLVARLVHKGQLKMINLAMLA